MCLVAWALLRIYTVALGFAKGAYLAALALVCGTPGNEASKAKRDMYGQISTITGINQVMAYAIATLVPPIHRLIVYFTINRSQNCNSRASLCHPRCGHQLQTCMNSMSLRPITINILLLSAIVDDPPFLCFLQSSNPGDGPHEPKTFLRTQCKDMKQAKRT